MKPHRSTARLLAALLLFGGSLLAAGALHAQLLTQIYNFSPNAAVPDNSFTGASDTEAVSSTIASITQLRVTLSIVGNSTAFNGDFYAYLTNGAGFAVLLNREGRTASNSLGYADNGFNVTLDDAAANGDIHSYQATLNPGGAALTGTWQPDGRNVNPTTSLDTSPRTAMLSSFTGQDPNGNWTLLVADVSSGGVGTFASWGLAITGIAVPEPGTWTLMAISAGMLAAAWRRRRV